MPGPYVKTGVAEGRPEYENAEFNQWSIQFRDNQWVLIGPGDTIRLFNPKQDLTSPTTGWRTPNGMAGLDKVLQKVPYTPPPRILSIQGDSIPDIAGIYTLSDIRLNGYPYYYSEG